MAPPAKPPSSRRPGSGPRSGSGSASGSGGRSGPGTGSGPRSHAKTGSRAGGDSTGERPARKDGQRPSQGQKQASGQLQGSGSRDAATPTGPRSGPGVGRPQGDAARPASPGRPATSGKPAFPRKATFVGKPAPPRKIVYANRPRSDIETVPTPRAADRPEGDRIAKLLARAGVASRREIERMIEEGRIALHGEVLDTPATILTSLDGVTVDGNLVQKAEAARLFMFHKPAGCLTAERDPKGRPTIYDRLPDGLPRLVPVGRLDYNTEGLLLLTNDGGLKRQLELPSTGVERSYRARAFGDISQEQLEELVMGIEIDGVRYGPIEANLERRTGRNTWIEMTLTEGKNREVRRVLEHFGLEVSRLIRTRYGPFVLGDSAIGEVAEVSTEDLNVFRKTLK
ncbi:MAG TPA: pseudouridine synthase [Sphingobium sp.]